jgi:DNA-binding NarL/FixJ family response regulator
VALKAFVVEDSVAIRDSLVAALAELAGIETAGVAGTEDDAVRWLSDASHHWDLAIVDLALAPGGGSGFGVLRALAKRPASRGVVVLTGLANAQVRSACEALGTDAVFDKAMETEALLDWCAARARGTQPSI